jgi:hypothetical protein
MISRPLGSIGASSIGTLFTKQELKAKSAQSKALELAEELVNGQRKELTTIAMQHGIFNEEEAFNLCVKPNWKNAKYQSSESIHIQGELYATPDVVVPEECVIDIKCPYTIDSFFKNFESVSKNYLAQLQCQMLATELPKGILLFYLTSTRIDEYGNKIEFDIPIQDRVKLIEIPRDEEMCGEIITRVDGLMEMRDTIYKYLCNADLVGDVEFFDLHKYNKVTRYKDKSNLLAWGGKLVRNAGTYYTIEPK